LRCSRTRRTARSRTSGENLVTFLFMAPFSQELEPPQNPGRFNYTRECLAIEVDGSLRGEHVVAALTRLAQYRPLPRYIKADNGSEFISKALDKWAYENGVEIDFSRPGKPTDNAKNESFNGRFREECLNAHWFLSLEDARRKIEVWCEYYNEARPHSALQWMTPAEFARQCTDRAGSARPEEPEFSS
ncbi:integrase core domain-containing protein, partial [Burkholderia cenocepacia]